MKTNNKIYRKVLIIIISVLLMHGFSSSIVAEKPVLAASGGIGYSIADTFPDTNLANAIANEIASGDVNTILTQAMIDNVFSLDLNGKNISDLTGIGNFTNLTDLYLGNNNLTSLPIEIGKLVNLQYLSIPFNPITNLPKEIGQLSNLQRLDIIFNSLTSLPSEIGDLSQLTTLNLGYNQIASLPKEIGKLKNLAQLNMPKNLLTSVPNEIGMLTNLTTLNLGNNKIESLPNEITNLTNLNYLFLFNNQLTTFNTEITTIPNLLVLDLSNNKFTQLPIEIGNLTELRELYLSNNQLTSLPTEIGNLSHLQLLLIDNNQLTSLPNEIGNLINIQEPVFSLSGNLLPTNYPDILNSLSFHFIINYEDQRNIALKDSISPYSIQSENDLNSINLFDITILSDDSTISLSHTLILTNYVDENNQPVNISDYIKNGIVIKNGKLFAQVRATGIGLFPNNSDHAITSKRIELQFTIPPSQYTLSFNLNGAEGITPPNQTLSLNALATEPPQPVRLNYTFNGWNTKQDGTGMTWDFKTTTMPANQVTLYAQWLKNINPDAHYTLRFDLNGATGVDPANQTLTVNQKATQPTKPIRDGYSFVGWNTTADGSGIKWNFETSLMPANDITLYAQWSKNDDPGTGDTSSALLFSQLLAFATVTIFITNKRRRIKH